MKITVDHPQFEAFVEDGAKQNNQTKSEFFERCIIGMYIDKYTNEGLTDDEIIKEFSEDNKHPIDLSKYKISDSNFKIFRKHFTDDFDYESLEFKIG